MRYINSYKLFESFNDIKSTIEDILRDLEDIDIRVDINNWNGIEVFLTPPDSIKYETIKPNIEHLVSFLEENGWRIDTIYNIVDLKPSIVEFTFICSTVANVLYYELNDKEIGRLELRFVKV